MNGEQKGVHHPGHASYIARASLHQVIDLGTAITAIDAVNAPNIVL